MNLASNLENRKNEFRLQNKLQAFRRHLASMKVPNNDPERLKKRTGLFDILNQHADKLSNVFEILVAECSHGAAAAEISAWPNVEGQQVTSYYDEAISLQQEWDDFAADAKRVYPNLYLPELVAQLDYAAHAA